MGAGSSFTENGAISYGSIGSELMNQFFKAGVARGRSYSDVWRDQAALWNENPELAIRFPFYLRMITRKTDVMGKSTDKVQRGQGARDEAFKRLLWVACYHPAIFHGNLWILPVVGSWKDLWTIMSMAREDEMPTLFTLDENRIFSLIAAGINNEHTKELIKKYMPRIRSDKQCTTSWAKSTNDLAKAFAKFVGWSYMEYREFKSTGKAHAFQSTICGGMYDQINWGAIPGQALLNLVSG